MSHPSSTTASLKKPEPKEKSKKPDWLRVRLLVGKEYTKVRNIVDQHKLHTP